jgi:hypothetical protein
MKVEELRIGNLLRDKVTKTELRVIKLTDQDIVTYVIDRSMFPLQDGWGAEPIPLTEEWKLKFGFEKTEWDNFNSYRLIIGNNDYTIVLYSDGNCEVGDIITCKIEYVHQLQNLYFALKGEELTKQQEQ